MKSKKLKVLLGISFMTSIIGFILDMNERIDNVFLNLFEVIMMTLIVFGLLIVITKVIESIKMKFYKQ